jgi:hypothetical protein
MQSIADNWFGLVSSFPALSEDTKRSVTRLRSSESCYRLSSPGAILGTNSKDSLDSRSLSADPVENSTGFATTFSLRLREDTLKGAYRLISDPETPCRILLDKFRHCIFVSTRAEIRKHLELLIRDSNSVLEHPRQTLEHPTDESWPTASTIVEPGTDVADKLQDGDRYVDPLGVHDYLADKGLAFDRASPYVEFSAKSSLVRGSSLSEGLTVFEEVCETQKIRIDLNELHRGKSSTAYYSL